MEETKQNYIAQRERIREETKKQIETLVLGVINKYCDYIVPSFFIDSTFLQENNITVYSIKAWLEEHGFLFVEKTNHGIYFDVPNDWKVTQ